MGNCTFGSSNRYFCALPQSWLGKYLCCWNGNLHVSPAATIAPKNLTTSSHQQTETKLELLRLYFTWQDSLGVSSDDQVQRNSEKDYMSSSGHGLNPERHLVSYGTSADFCQSMYEMLLALPKGDKMSLLSPYVQSPSHRQMKIFFSSLTPSFKVNEACYASCSISLLEQCQYFKGSGHSDP